MLGSHLAYHLLQTKEKIIAIKRPESNITNVLQTFNFYTAHPNKFFNRIEWRNADILDYESIDIALKNVSKIYHCAAIVSFNTQQKSNIIENNVQGTANLVNAALKNQIQKFCHVSSIAALGQEIGKPISEESQRNVTTKYSGYAISKYQSELEVWRASEEGLNTVIVNPSVILGAFPNWTTGSASLFYNVNKGLKFYTKGKTGYIDVHDVVDIMVKLMESNISSQKFILSAENLTYQEIINLIAEKLEVKSTKYLANKTMLNIAWRLEKAKSFITRTEPVITKDVTKSAISIDDYSNEKIKNTLNYNFTPINKTVEQIANIMSKSITNSLQPNSL